MRYLRTFESFEADKQVSVESLVSSPEFKKACDNAKSFIESEVIPNLTPEELQKFKSNVMETANKIGASKGSDADEVTALLFQEIQDKTNAPDLKTAVMSISGQANEGIISTVSDWLDNSPKVKRFALQLGVVLGLGTVVAGFIICLATAGGSQGGGWSGSPFLTEVHEYCRSITGSHEGAGPIGLVMVLGGAISSVMLGSKANLVGDEIRRNRARGAREAF